MSHCDELKPCVACGLSTIEQQKHYLPLSKGGFVYKGIDYHVNDFVYHHNYSEESSLLHIGQIIEILDQPSEDPHLIVCQYGHYDTVARTHSKGPIPLDNVCVFLL